MLDVNGGSHIRSEGARNHALRGKIAVVTGAAAASGRPSASRLADEGALVVVVRPERRRAQRRRAQAIGGRRTRGRHRGDISDGRRLRAISSRTCIAIRARIDVLVQQCRHQPPRHSSRLTEDDWRTSFAINLDFDVPPLPGGAAAHDRGRRRGDRQHRLAVGPLSGAEPHRLQRDARPRWRRFTQNLARDYAPHKIRVNAVCPGEIHTPMLEAGVKRSGRTIADLDKLVPFGRIGKPEEVAALVAFLASDEAAFMCGSLVEITGAQAVP